MSTKALTANTAKRNQKLKDAFRTRYTTQPKPSKYSRDYVERA